MIAPVASIHSTLTAADRGLLPMRDPLNEKKNPSLLTGKGCTPLDNESAVAKMSASAHSITNGRPLKYSLICSLVVTF